MAHPALSILVVLGTALAVKAQLSYNTNPYNAQVSSGALGVDYNKVAASQEDHDKKNFGVNYSSDRGSSSSLNKVNAQLGAAGSTAQASYPYQYGYQPYVPSYTYPQYPQVPLQPIGGGWTSQVPVPQHPINNGWASQVPQQPIRGGWRPF